MNHQPVVLICLDSLRPDHLKYMPNLTRLADEGTFFKDSRTVFPSDTCPASISLITGCYPEKNGYSYGFYIDPTTSQYVSGRLKPFERHVWKTSVLGATMRDGLKVASISMPGLNETTPSFLADGDKIVELGYKEFRKGITDKWVFNAALHVLGHLKFDLLMFTTFALDDAQHGHGCHSKEAVETCRSLDEGIAELWKRMPKDANLVVVSDHGQTNTTNRVNLHLALQELRLDALVSDGGSAYLKLGGDESIENVIELLNDIRGVDRVIGHNAIRKRKAYFKPHTVNDIQVYPPDLMIDAKENWTFTNKGPLYWRKFSGDHGGIREEEMRNTLIMHGLAFREGITVEETVHIADVAPTIANILNVRMETQGEPIREALKYI